QRVYHPNDISTERSTDDVRDCLCGPPPHTQETDDRASSASRPYFSSWTQPGKWNGLASVRASAQALPLTVGTSAVWAATVSATTVRHQCVERWRTTVIDLWFVAHHLDERIQNPDQTEELACRVFN